MAYYKFDGSIAAATGNPVAGHWGTSGVDTIYGTDLSESFGGGQGDTMYGGGGNDLYYLYHEADRPVEYAGGGVDTIQAWFSLDLNKYANIENVIVAGDDRYASGNSADNIVQGQDGRQHIYGGGGQDVLIGGGGADTFIVYKGEGNDVIADFSVAEDKVRLKAGYTSFDQVVSHMTQVGSDVILDLGGGDALKFNNVNKGQFTAKNFLLQLDYGSLGTMTFSDEFNSAPSLWDAAHNPNGFYKASYDYQGQDGIGSYTLPGNGEKQIYVSPYYRHHDGDYANPFKMNGDGTMSIVAKPVAPNDELYGYNYTSGMLSTRLDYPNASFAQQYGYFEIRADVPEQNGTWPAFWLVPQDWSWPPELDVMEILGGDTNVVYTTAHSSDGGHTSSGQANFVPGNSQGMHTYGTLWTPTELIWYVDGLEVFRTATPSDMHKPMILIANLALGGWAGGYGSAGWPGAEFQIDYIRAYSLGEGGSTVTPPPGPTDPGPTDPGPVNPPVDPNPTDPNPTDPNPTDPNPTEPKPTDPAGETVRTSAATYTMLDGTVNVVMTGSGWQTVIGNNADNTITSNNSINWMYGGAGNDTLIAGRDRDVMNGGAGNDTFVFLEAAWNPNTIEDFTVGEDVIDIRGMMSKVGYTGNQPFADGFLKIESDGAGGAKLWWDIDGAAGSQFNFWHISNLIGVDPASLQVVDGFIKGKADTPTDPGPSDPGPVDPNPTDPDPTDPEPTEPGEETVYTSAATYTMLDGTLNVVMTGSGWQTVIGNNADNTITSNNSINWMYGGAGNDTLIAGRDRDVMNGGAGNDTFVFLEAAWNPNTIEDFTVGEDVIDIRGMMSKVGYTGNQPFADGFLKIESDGAGGAKLWWDIDGAAGSQFNFWHISNLVGVDPASLQVVDGFIKGKAATPVDPNPTDPGPTDPGPVDPNPTDPDPTDPGPIDPNPTPARPSPADVFSLPESAEPTNAVTGNGGKNTLKGTSGADLMNGLAGADKMMGGAGDDTYVVEGKDTVSESAGGGIDTVITANASYVLPKHVENLILTGSSAQNVKGNDLSNLIVSNAAGSILSGGGGRDILVSGGGPDVMIGGSGADVFRFDTLTSSAARITDFSADDVLDLRGLLKDYTGADPVADSWLKFVSTNVGVEVHVDIDGSGSSAGFAHLVTLSGVSAASLVMQDDWVFV